jgi:hypothetical protein
MKKKFIVTWDEYRTCSTIVEAASKEEAERKFLDGEHGEVDEETESCDELEIYEADDDETGSVGEIKANREQSDRNGKTAEEADKSSNAFSESGEEVKTSPPFLLISQELKGGG